MAFMSDMETIVIENPTDVRKLKDAFRSTAALDVETTTDNKDRLGDYFDPTFKIVSVHVTFDGKTAFVIPIYHNHYKEQYQVGLWQLVYPTLDQVDYWIMQNGKFDYKALKAKYGREYFPSFDTMGAEYVIDENLKKDLETLAIKYLGVKPWKHILDKKDPYEISKNDLVEYGALDVIYTYRIWEQQRNLIGSKSNKGNHHISNPLFFDILMPAYKSLADMEILGMPVDKEKFEERWFETNEEVEKVQDRIMDIVGYEVNPRSPKQLGNLLYKELGLPVLEATKSGAPSTAEAVLLRLKEMDESGVIEAVLDYRHWAGYQSRYFKNWDERLDKNHRLHTNFKPFHTVTGRLSSSDPNLQQVPRDTFIRGMIGGVEDFKLVEIDYSQVELRLVAHYSDDKALLSAFNSNADIHTLTAQAMTGKDNPEPEERKKAKAVNFGFVYGMGADKFMVYARDNFGVKVSKQEAIDTRNKFFNTYPALVDWHDRQRQIVKRRGYVMNPLGRLRRLDDINSSNEYFRAQAERQAINSPVQSLASDLMLMSLIELDGYVNHPSLNRGKFISIIGTVHDSILLLVHKEILEQTCEHVKNIMENPKISPYDFELKVPLVADIKVGDYWSEGAEDLTLE